MASEKITAIVESVKTMTVLELKELVDTICEEFGVSAVAAAAPAAAGAAAPAEEEKTEFDVILADVGANKMQVIKAVIQKAVQPQLVQSYFSGDKSRFLELVFRSSKFSYFLLFFVAYPLILICRPVVELWLVCVPQYTVQFIQLYLIFLLIDALSGSLWVSSETIGNIAKYQFTVSSMIIMNIPIIYILFKFGCSPVYAVIVRIAINFITHCYRIFYLKHKVNFPVRRYVVEVMFRCLWVSVCIIPVPFFLHKFLTSSWGSHILVVLTSLIISGLVIYKFGLDAKERGFVISTVTNKFMFLKKQ